MLIRSPRCLLVALLIVLSSGFSAASAMADPSAADHEVAEQQECLENGLELSGYLIVQPPGNLRGAKTVSFHGSLRQVTDRVGDAQVCEQRGARSSFMRLLVMDIHGRYVSDTADPGGWTTLVSESNAKVEGVFTVHLRHPIEPPTLPNGQRVHCMPEAVLQPMSRAHYADLEDSASTAWLIKDGAPGFTINWDYDDHGKVCLASQLRQALRRAKAQVRRQAAIRGPPRVPRSGGR